MTPTSVEHHRRDSTADPQPSITHSRLLKVCRDTIAYARDRDFAGYNKHDALNSPLLATLSFGNRWLRLLYTQGVMRAPVNLRPLLGVRPTKNPKGLALFAMACFDLFRATGDQQWKDHGLALLQWLRDHACRDLPGASWGYPYPWQDAGFFAPRHLPNRVVTCFVAQAFLSAYDLLGREQDAAICEDIGEFLLEAPKRLFESDEMLCLSYVPDERITWVVMDVSALAGAVLARTSRIIDCDAVRDEAARLIHYVVDKQTEYGAWYYSHPPADSHITHDNYHTGFILDAILDYTQATGDDRFAAAYDRGLRFYAEHLFTADGAPKWMHDREYPYDIHGAGQGILTFARAAELDPRWLPMAQRIADWSLRNMYNPQGWFANQQCRWYTKRFNLLRWCNGWMARGLAALATVDPAPEHGPVPEKASSPVA